MKMNRCFMLALAGLAFAACSNEENAGTAMEGGGIVKIKVLPLQNGGGRTATDGTTGNSGEKVSLNGDISVTLTTTDGATATKNIDAATGGTLIFTTTAPPSRATATINGGEPAEGTAIESLQLTQAELSSARAFGSVDNFTEEEEIIGNDGITRKSYKGSIQMEMPYARLEVSGITHVDVAGESCKFTSLTIGGIYLDKVYGKYKDAAVTDYCWPAIEGVAPLPVLRDEITSPNNFLEEDVVWPRSGVYAYNFYTGTAPELKIYFSEAQGTGIKSPRYAIAKLTENFQPGHIYRIIDIKLADKNIIGNEEGEVEYQVEVMVSEAAWVINNLDPVWVEQE